MSLDPLLLEILACPCPAHAPLRAETLAGEPVLVCTSCGLAFPVRDEIPVMLLDEAVPFGGDVPAADVPGGVPSSP
ncbi:MULTISPECIES: Trm112 family protein [unclassified Frankia]|uniref:Trm112 family protein n=1 Tax=unclassified Frankia TaxID=2632575 RepID=UPI001EF440F1|nr:MULTISPECIES: Trm112 family protein [unclassified Frankia]